MYRTEFVNLDELYLDEENPRFTTREDKGFSQDEIINYLIEYEELVELTKKINDYGGFTPGERLIVVKERGKYIVLEGNRRTSSLKLLAMPNIAKSQKSQVPNISHDCAQFIKNIPVDVVKSRGDADRALVTRHIDGIRLWSQFSKMKFYEKMFANGKSLDEISQMSQESNLLIKRTLHRYSILNTILDNYSKILPHSTYLSSTVDAKLDTDLLLTRMYTYYTDSKGLNLNFSQNDHTLILPENKEKKDSLITTLVLLAKMHWEDDLINSRILNKKADIDKFFNSAKTDIKKTKILSETHEEFLRALSKYFNIIDPTDQDKSELKEPDSKKPDDEQNELKNKEAENKNLDNEQNEDELENKEPENKNLDNEQNKDDSENKETENKNSGGGKKSGGNKRTYTRRQNQPKNRKYPFQGINYTGDVIGISRSLYELHHINVTIFSLSSTVLIRTLLECTLQEYILHNQINIKVKNQESIKLLSIDSLLKTCTNDGNGNYKELLKTDRTIARILKEANNKRDPDELNIVAHGNYREPSFVALWDIERRWFSAIQIMIDSISNKL